MEREKGEEEENKKKELARAQRAELSKTQSNTHGARIGKQKEGV